MTAESNATPAVGQVLQSEPFPPISRLTLALYCGASGDDNPLHVDIDAARQAGYDDVIAHGMLPMAFLARFLTEQFDPLALRQLQVRFSAMTRVGARLTCRAEPVETSVEAGGDDSNSTSTYLVRVLDQDGETKLSGRAVIACRGKRAI
jgi:acyl dehydratase